MNWTHDMQNRLVKDPPEIDPPVLYDNNGNQILTEFDTGLTYDAWNPLVTVEGYGGTGEWGRGR